MAPEARATERSSHWKFAPGAVSASILPPNLAARCLYLSRAGRRGETCSLIQWNWHRPEKIRHSLGGEHSNDNRWIQWIFTSRLLLLLLLSHFSRVRLCATPWTTAHQVPPSLGFSRQEHWSGLPLPSPMHESEKGKWSRSVVSNPQQPHGLQTSRLLRLCDSPGRRTAVGCRCRLRQTLEFTSNARLPA